MANDYEIGGALAPLYKRTLEPLRTPYQQLRAGLEPSDPEDPLYELEHSLASRAAPVLYRNLADEGNGSTRAVTPELVDQLLRLRNADRINQPRASDHLLSPEQLAERTREPSFGERVAFDYLPRGALFAGEMMRPQVFSDYMTRAEDAYNAGDYGSTAAYLGLAPVGALADVAGAAILPAGVEKGLGAAAAKGLDRLSTRADAALGGRAGVVLPLAAGGAALTDPNAAEAAPAKWYSVLERAIKDAPQDKGTVAQWLGYLRNRPGVKPEELEYTLGGALKHLDPSSPVDKTWLLRTAKNKVPVENIRLGDISDAHAPAFYDNVDYRLPGDADRYREVVVTSPEARHDSEITGGHFGPEDFYDVNEDALGNAAGGQIGWIRGDVRSLSDGSKAFHVDEFQSDPAQRAIKGGWDSNPFLPNSRTTSKSGLAKKMEDITERLENEYGVDLSEVSLDQLVKDENTFPILRELAQEFINTREAYQKAKDAVPDRPWKKDWPKLLFRQALWEAAQEDADHLTWTPAAIQQERWGGAKLGRDRLYEEVIPKVAAEEAKRLGLPEGSVGKVETDTVGDAVSALPELVDQFAKAATAEPHVGGRFLDGLVHDYDLTKAESNTLRNTMLDLRKGEIGEDQVFERLDFLRHLITPIPQKLYSLKLTPEVRAKILKDGLPKFVGAGVAPGLVDRFLSESE